MALVLFACALVFSLEAFVRGGPASPLAIGDKTFFIAALLAMQYEKGLVLLGSIGALALMTILSVVIGRIFHSVPAQFQTTLPIAKYAAVTLLLFFGLKSIKDAWNLPSNVAQGGEKSSPKLDEYFEAEELVKEKVSRRPSNPLGIVWKSFSLIFFAVLLGSVGALAVMTILSVVIGRIFHSVSTQFHTTLPIGKYAAVTLLVFFGLISIKDAWELLSNVAQGGDEYVGAEELVKEKVSKRLSNPLEIVWKSFSLVFFVEWGDRSMLVTIALGAAQCPWVVASGAIAGHLLATSSAILGGAFLANYTSEKLNRRDE